MLGCQISTVIVLNDKILKIQTISEEAGNEFGVMEWLLGEFRH